MPNLADSELQNFISFAEKSALIQSNFGKFWNLTRLLSGYENNGKNRAILWRHFLWQIGIGGFIDYGNGVIHRVEPTQCLFLSKTMLELVEIFDNKLTPQKIIKKTKIQQSAAINKVLKFYGLPTLATKINWAMNLDKFLTYNNEEKLTYLINSNFMVVYLYKIIDEYDTGSIEEEISNYVLIGFLDIKLSSERKLALIKKLFNIIKIAKNSSTASIDEIKEYFLYFSKNSKKSFKIFNNNPNITFEFLSELIQTYGFKINISYLFSNKSHILSLFESILKPNSIIKTKFDDLKRNESYNFIQEIFLNFPPEDLEKYNIFFLCF